MSRDIEEKAKEYLQDTLSEDEQEMLANAVAQKAGIEALLLMLIRRVTFLGNTIDDTLENISIGVWHDK